MARSDFDVVETALSGTTINFTFKIEDEAQLLIVEYDTDGLEVERVRGDDNVYLSSVTFDAVNGGGTVTLAAAITSGHTVKVLLANDTPTQTYEFKNKADFTLSRLENALDFLSGQIQRLAYLAKRSVQLRPLEDSANYTMELPEPVAGHVLGWDADGTGITTYSPGGVTLAAAGILDTDDLAEGASNLYFTNVRADARADVRIAASTINTLSPTATTKGDLLVRNSSTVVRFPVGTNGQILRANSSAAEGIEWGSGVTSPYRSVTTTDTATTADEILFLSGASFTQTLFTAVGNTGKVLVICHNGTSLTQVYTLNTTGGQTIGGIASGSYALYTNGERLKLVSDGTNWQILEHYTATDWSTPTAITITATTTNPTKGSSPTNDSISWCRSGKNVKIIMSYKNANAGTSGTGDYLFALPSGLTADNTAFPYYTTVLGGNSPLATNAFGIFATSISTTQENVGHISMYDSTKFRCLVYAPTGDGAISASYFGLSDSAVAYVASFEIPISGWRP